VDRFLEIFARDKEELRRYWVDLGEERTMGSHYLVSFEEWSKQPALDGSRVSLAANQMAFFLKDGALFTDAEPLFRHALAIDEKSYGPDHPDVAIDLNGLANLLDATNRLAEAEPLMRRALAIDEKSYGPDHPEVAIELNNLAQLLKDTNRLAGAEPLMRRTAEILLKFTRTTGHRHPNLQVMIDNYTGLLDAMGRSRKQVQVTMREMAPEFFR
jgi:tetratricopeptide (TPR) repeat protein